MTILWSLHGALYMIEHQPKAQWQKLNIKIVPSFPSFEDAIKRFSVLTLMCFTARGTMLLYLRYCSIVPCAEKDLEIFISHYLLRHRRNRQGTIFQSKTKWN